MNAAGGAFDAFRTFPEMLGYVARNYENPAALNAKTDEGWQPISTRELVGQVCRLALALKTAGVSKGDTVALLAVPGPYWLIADLSILMLGAVSIPLFPTDPPDTVRFKLEDAGVRHMFLFEQAAWPAVEKSAGSLATIFTHGFDVPHKGNRRCEELSESRSASEEDATGLLVNWSDAVTEHDLATIIYTSGSTGVPKGVELTHGNLITQVHAARQSYPLEPGRRALSCLPLAHSFERMIVYFYLAYGISVYFNRAITELGEDLRAVQPSLMTVVPRILEKLQAKFIHGIEENTGLKRRIGRWALARANAREPEAGTPGLADRLADRLVYAKFRQALGGQLYYVITGGAATGPPLYRFLVNVGIPLYQGYGLTEASPVLTANRPSANRIGTVGTAFPGVTVKLTDDGEIIGRGPNIMRGYHNRPEETAKTIDADGWLHTGDSGELDADGFLTITGRIKELLKTSCGEYVAPAPIEQALVAHPLVDMAMILGEGRKFVSCLLFPDLTGVAHMKEEHDCTAMSDEEFLRSPAVDAAITALLETVNATLEHWEQIRKYRFVLSAPSVAGGELTQTMKLRRHIITEKHLDLIDEMYRED